MAFGGRLQPAVALDGGHELIHQLPYAYAVKPGDEAWLQRVDEFVAAIKRDGRLEAAAKRHGLAEIVVRKSY